MTKSLADVVNYLEIVKLDNSGDYFRGFANGYATSLYQSGIIDHDIFTEIMKRYVK